MKILRLTTESDGRISPKTKINRFDLGKRDLNLRRIGSQIGFETRIEKVQDEEFRIINVRQARMVIT